MIFSAVQEVAGTAEASDPGQTHCNDHGHDDRDGPLAGRRRAVVSRLQDVA